MEEEKNRCESSNGSEARPNTPFMDPFAKLNILEDDSGYTSTTKNQSVHPIRIPKDKATKPQWFHKYSSFARRKTLPNLPSLEEEQDFIEKDVEDEMATVKNGRKCDRKSDRFKKLRFSSWKTNQGEPNPPKENTNCCRNEVSLPKIDTYCISYARPSTNHGFAYAVSSTELLNGKNTIQKRAKQKKAKFRSKISTPENGLSRQGSVYLLFRAPSRACGLNIPDFKVRSKELHHVKDAKRRKTGAGKNAEPINIVRLPDIKQDVWKQI
ncbi:uncharacterized protein LOC114523686 [Dendronephthya gigantea]|uniref:uncharacterized protein LOC114523686 n=1 Tax=Dendronephthya gigantea TaxID=151771 RepID=UPI00106A5604|nr:uncharacterized protein LOC114523686 [Dendronephthya gigantea]